MPKSRIAHKRTSTSGLLPNTTNSANSAYIAAGELAVNLTDRKIVSSTGTVPFEVGANLTSLYVGTGEITANATHLKLGSAALFANGSNGTSGQVLTSNGTSAYWAAAGGGGGSPGGSTTQIQFNDGGSFAGSANLTFDKTNALLTLGNTSVNAQFFGNTGDIRFNQITTTALTLTANSLGFRGCPHNEQSGTTYTFTIHDAGKAVINTRTSGTTTWTLPNNSSVPFPIGSMIILDNSYYGSGGTASNIDLAVTTPQVGIRKTPTELTTTRQYSKRLSRGQVATLRKIANDGTAATPTSIIRASSGTRGEVTLTNHGFQVGDFIKVSGATQSQYNGLHRITAVSSTSVFQYILATDPGVNATGTLSVQKAEFWSISGNFADVDI